MLIKNKQHILLGFLCILIILPASILGILILKYSVNTPYWDQFNTVSYINQYYRYFNIPLKDLIAQHNESRMVFPRLFFIGLAYLTRWDVRYEMLATFLLACGISLNLYLLNRLTVGGSLLKGLLILFISNLLIFSPVQYENWLWGFQTAIFISMFCMTSSILIAYLKFSTRIKFLICTCLAIISTFSFANGILNWIVVPPVLAVNTWKDLKKEKWLFMVWITVFIFNVSVYFYKYHQPADSPGIVYAISHPLSAVNYFFIFFGSGFAFLKLNTARDIGITLVIMLIAVCIYLLRFRKNLILWHRAIGWLAIASYTIISASITTVGRVGFGVGQAMAPRYTTFSLYLPVSLLALTAIIIDDAVKQGYISKNKRLVTGIALTIATILLYFHTCSSMIAINEMNNWRLARLQGKACLLFINVSPEQKCLSEKVWPRGAEIKKLINPLNDLGFLNPPLLTSRRIQDIQGSEKVTPDNYGYGWFDDIKQEKDNTYNASGWARLPAREEPADAVVLTYEDGKNGDIVFTISDTIIERPDVAKITEKDGYLISGWSKSFSTRKLPKGEVKIKAWAFDTNTGKAFKLNGSHILQNP